MSKKKYSVYWSDDNGHAQDCDREGLSWDEALSVFAREKRAYSYGYDDYDQLNIVKDDPDIGYLSKVWKAAKKG